MINAKFKIFLLICLIALISIPVYAQSTTFVLSVSDDDTTVFSPWNLSFTGNVEVSDPGDGTATINVPAGGGSGDVTAAANMDDNTLIKGDGGAKGVQDSGVTLDDDNDMTGIRQLSASSNVSNGIADFTYDGSATATVAVEADGSTLSVGGSGVKVADAGITATQLQTSLRTFSEFSTMTVTAATLTLV